MSRRSVEILTLLYVFILTLLSIVKLSPNVPMSDVVGIDKVVHIIFYFVLNMLLLLVCSLRGFVMNLSSMVVVTLVAIGYGCLMEIIQQFTGRECSVLDIVANSIGALLALPLFCNAIVMRFIERFINE